LLRDAPAEADDGDLARLPRGGRSPALLIFLEVNPATSMYVTTCGGNLRRSKRILLSGVWIGRAEGRVFSAD